MAGPASALPPRNRAGEPARHGRGTHAAVTADRSQALTLYADWAPAIRCRPTRWRTNLNASEPTPGGEKPTRREELLKRYLYPSKYASQSVQSEQIGNRFHSQLFRNIVF